MDNRYKSIHETALAHIMDIWDALKNIEDIDLGDIRGNKSPLGKATSIASASSNLTMVFPVLCSKNIDIKNASMISKALEKNIVSMLQRLFASWQVADNGVENFKDYLAKFHSNLSTKAADLDDVFRLVDAVDEMSIMDKKNPVNLQEKSLLREDLQNINFVLPESTNDTPLTSYIVREDKTVDLGGDVYVKRNGKFINTKDLNSSDKSGSRYAAKDDKDSYKNNKQEFFTKQVLDSDFKKANELMPTTMTVNFNILKGDNVVNYDTALAAVKAKLYPIASEDIVNHLSDKVITRNWITNFVRASTREISFMKDFVLAIDKAKLDAISLSDRKRTSDKMWKVLERRALTARIKRAMIKADTASVAAITTLCISQEEVEFLRKNYNIDIERVNVVRNLFESLNLMCIVIVDENLEVAKFIYDEDEPMWETISFNHLERESSDSTYKRVVNLMTKMSR